LPSRILPSRRQQFHGRQPRHQWHPVFALLVFAVLALQYRASHPAGSVAFQFDSTSGEAYTTSSDHPVVTNGVSVDTVVRDASNVPLPKKDAAGNIVPYQSTTTRPMPPATSSLTHAKSVISPHHISWMFIQATVAILILVGFESVTAMVAKPRTPNETSPSRSSPHFCCRERSFTALSTSPQTTSSIAATP